MKKITSINQIGHIAQELKDSGYVVFDYQPGNSTRYEMSMVNADDGYTFVGLMNHSAYQFRLKDYQHKNYVGPKMNVGDADAEVLADLFNEIGNYL